VSSFTIWWWRTLSFGFWLSGLNLRFSIFGFRILVCLWRSATLFFVALSFCLGTSAPAHGQVRSLSDPYSIRCPPPADPHYLYFECVGRPFDFIEETMTKDWGGLRADLYRIGITPVASYTSQLMGNPGGGKSQGFTYSGTLQASIFWDFEKLLHIPGFSFNIGGAWSTGKSLSAHYIGNSFIVQSAYTAPDNGTNNLTLGEIYFQQQLFNNSLVIAAGRLSPGATFGTLPVFNNYLNASINSNPGSFNINNLTFTTYPPGVEWGAQAIYNIAQRFEFAAGVFNTNQNSADGGKGGLDFAFRQGNRGALSVAQINYLVNHAASDSGLPGQYSFGGYYDSNKFGSLSRPHSTESGTYSIYALFQQMVNRDGEADSLKGLTVWGATVLAPKSKVNIMPYFLGGGLSYQGLISGRDSDIASAGVIWGTFSRYIPRTTAETVIEANYQIALTGWLSVTPDIQYVIRPSGSSAIKNAFVLGTQLAIVF
jgi:porin